MIESPLQLVIWGWALGLALFGAGAPVVVLLGWGHAVLTRHRNLTASFLASLEQEKRQSSPS